MHHLWLHASPILYLTDCEGICDPITPVPQCWPQGPDLWTPDTCEKCNSSIQISTQGDKSFMVFHYNYYYKIKLTKFKTLVGILWGEWACFSNSKAKLFFVFHFFPTRLSLWILCQRPSVVKFVALSYVRLSGKNRKHHSSQFKPVKQSKTRDFSLAISWKGLY